MRTVAAAAQTERERRIATVELPMLWVEARDRETGDVEAVGIWGGLDTETITVIDMFTGVSQSRTFYGAGSMLEVGAVRHEAGLTIRSVSVTLSSLAPAVLQAFRAYEPRGAQAQLWRRTYAVETMTPLAVERWVKGYINAAPIERPAPGGDATLTAEIVTTARMLTVTNALMKSHQAQRARMPGDMFRQHKASIAQVEVPWASEKVKGT